MKFKSRPCECEAERFTDAANPPMGVQQSLLAGHFYVVTMHGQRVDVAPGDWIIKEPCEGHRYYPCKPEVFAKRWEPA